MTPHRALNWTLAALIALIMSTAYLLDGPSEQAAIQATADSVLDAQQAAAAASTHPATLIASQDRP
jgi:hypothetical protein